MLKRALSFFLIPFLLCLNSPVFASQVTASTSIIHKGVESSKSGKRIVLEAEVEDPSGVDLVRVYFKNKDMSDYVFVKMNRVESSNDFSAELPAPSQATSAIDYLILVKNHDNVVVKSQNFEIKIEATEASEDKANEPIVVYSEATQPQAITGFSDNIVLDSVESAAKFGVVIGLYSQTAGSAGAGAGATGAGSGTGGGAVSGGTVVASSGGMSGTAIAIGTVVVLAAGGAAVAVAGSSSSDSSSSSGSIDLNTIYGTWNHSKSYSSCSYSGTTTFNQDGTFSKSETGGCTDSPTSSSSYSGTWTLDGSALTLSDSGGTETGTYNPGDTQFQTSYTQSDGFQSWTTVYSR